jgi:hypothetical protein
VKLLARCRNDRKTKLNESNIRAFVSSSIFLNSKKKIYTKKKLSNIGNDDEDILHSDSSSGNTSHTMNNIVIDSTNMTQRDNSNTNQKDIFHIRQSNTSDCISSNEERQQDNQHDSIYKFALESYESNTRNYRSGSIFMPPMWKIFDINGDSIETMTDFLLQYEQYQREVPLVDTRLKPILKYPGISGSRIRHSTLKINKKKCAFSTLHIYFHKYTIGQGIPSDSGPSIGLGEKCENNEDIEISIDTFEDFRGGVIPDNYDENEVLINT